LGDFSQKHLVTLSGPHPFYFNEIQSTSDVIDGDLVYAVMTTPDNAIGGSAICKFSIKDINNM
jgi:semaphorin 6